MIEPIVLTTLAEINTGIYKIQLFVISENSSILILFLHRHRAIRECQHEDETCKLRLPRDFLQCLGYIFRRLGVVLETYAHDDAQLAIFSLEDVVQPLKPQQQEQR